MVQVAAVSVAIHSGDSSATRPNTTSAQSCGRVHGRACTGVLIETTSTETGDPAQILRRSRHGVNRRIRSHRSGAIAHIVRF
ncbi:hypothetical protein GCM10010171_55100 [Actinokineospora fastidiosa]|uniref:Uncharacterized protein n=1 Tax=Actinokineospora fastidiosa TaxID=1816 RepID=A0A918GQ28_9PSEU|nr:hypothetical protein GCM10010171_55100 [Actinokineospora fastidiosa]